MTRRWRWALGWLLLTTLVVLAARDVDWPRTLSAVASADPRWLALALLANWAILPLAAAQWLLFLPRGARVPAGKMFSIVALTASVSNGGPPLAGHATGIQLLATQGGLGHPAAVSVTLLDQIAEALAKLTIVALAAILVPGFEYQAAGVTLLLGAPALAVGFGVLAHRGDLVDRLAARSHGWAARPFRFLASTVGDLDALRRPGAFGVAVAFGIAQKAMEALAIGAVAAALGVSLPIWVVLAALVAVNLSVLVSVTPANLGIYEGAAFLVFRAAGVDADAALALALVAHAANLLPLAGTGWVLESTRLWPGRRARVLGLATLAGIGLAIHAWFAVAGDALDTDRALVLLMARHFAQGDFSVFFWQQNYMAALEPLLLTPLALVGWATPVAAGFVGIALTASLTALSVGLARRLGGTTWMALLLWAVPPAVVVHHHVALYGARLAATLLAVAAFAWSLRARTMWAWVGAGALAGLAYFGDHLMLTWAAAVMFVAGRRGRLGLLALGALPVVALDTVAAMMTPAIHLSGPNEPGEWMRNVPLLFGTTLPQLFGLLLSRAPGPLFEAPTPVVPQGLLWPVLAVPGAVALVALSATLVRHRRAIFAKEEAEGALAGQAVVLACVVGMGLFGLVGGAGDRWPARYLVLLWPAVSVFAALAVARWSPRVRPLAAAVALPAVFTLLADGTWPRGGDGRPAREEAEAVGRAVRESGAQAVWAEYWDAYRMALLVGESPPWVTLRVIERRPDWVRRAREASPVAYLVRRQDEEVLDLLDRSVSQGIRRLGDRDVGRFRLVLMERAASGLESRNPPPPRGWQMVAALSAGLLFAGALLAVGLLPRALALRRAVPPLVLLALTCLPAKVSSQAPEVRDSLSRSSAEPKVFTGVPYGSEAVFSPLFVVMTRGYDIMQAANHRRDVWTYPYGNAVGAVFDALAHPGAAVRRSGGWTRWVRREILPFAIEPQQAKWFPNYTEHLIGGGMTARMLGEWYRAQGVPYPKVWGGASLMVAAFMNEVTENRGEKVGSSTTVADLYVFDLGGVFLLQWDPLARFLSETLHMSEWSPLASLTFPNGEIHNNGQYFVYKIPLPLMDRTRLFWRLGLGSQLGVSRAVDGEHSLSVGAGVDTERRHVDPVTLKETIEVVASAGIFWDRNDSLLASILLSERLESFLSVNVYPGVLPGLGRDVGVWMSVARDGTTRLGLAHRRALGLGVGLGW